jgi:hypothetical protein
MRIFFIISNVIPAKAGIYFLVKKWIPHQVRNNNNQLISRKRRTIFTILQLNTNS